MFRAGCDINNITEFLRIKLMNGRDLRKLTIIDPYFFKYGNSSSTFK